MIKAAIFDLNGIFIQSLKLSDRFKDEFGIVNEEFLPALKEIMAKVRKPNAGDSFEYWKPYLEKWGIDLTRDQFFDFWFSAEKEVPELINMARKIKEKGIEIFILSNNFIERANYYKKNFKFLNELPKNIYYSWETGFVKPSPDAFKNLLKENDLNPEECIYFDNSKENIEVANGLGIKSFLFKDSDGLREILEEYWSI